MSDGWRVVSETIRQKGTNFQLSMFYAQKTEQQANVSLFQFDTSEHAKAYLRSLESLSHQYAVRCERTTVLLVGAVSKPGDTLERLLALLTSASASAPIQRTSGTKS